jgi:predicted transcriptional regulator
MKKLTKIEEQIMQVLWKLEKGLGESIREGVCLRII